MSKFGKFLDRTGGPPSAGGTALAAKSTAAEAVMARIAAEVSRPGEAERIVRGRTVQVAIALDATGSMAGMLRVAKDSIGEIIARVTAEAPGHLEIELFAYRDYDVGSHPLERSGLSSTAQPLANWLSRVRADGGGGNAGEAVEVALEAILEAGSFAAVLLIGDEPSNGSAELRAAGRSNAATARSLAGRMGERHIPIHSFVMGDDPRTSSDFKALANSSGGKCGRLDGSKEMIDLAVMAILSTIVGRGGVTNYMAGRHLSSNAAAFGQLLLGTSK